MRLRPGCEARCPACAHRLLTAPESMAQKAAWLGRMLAPWQDRLLPPQSVPEEARWAYREKVCLATTWQDGRWHFGLRRGEEIIPIPDCPVHTVRVRRMGRWLAEVLPGAGGFPMVYYVQSGAQATLVLKSAVLPDLDWLDLADRQALSGIGLEGLWLHLFPSAGRRVFHKTGWHLCWGQPRSRDEDGLCYGPTSFRQLLPTLHRQALAEATAFLAPSPDDYVLDLCCGTGGTLRHWAAYGARASGVEWSGEAVDCAAANAPTATVLRGTCAQRLPQLTAWWEPVPPSHRLLYANPPRTGLEPAVMAWIGATGQPARIAYLSCSAGTLARDLDQLEQAGYAVERLHPYDFFPQTHHVETLALLRRTTG